jgi:hypothetical protein
MAPNRPVDTVPHVQSVATVQTYVVRVWLPDRPGALGQVASRVGAVGADVVGIEILERGGGSAIDEITVMLPDPALVDRLVAEIRQVEGVAVEDVRPVPADRPEGALAALAAAEAIVTAAGPERQARACRVVRTLLDADWAAVVTVPAGHVVGNCGDVVDAEWLAAFLNGSEHLDHGSQHGPGDLAWARLPQRGAALACGREGRVFHERERLEVLALARILDALD